MIRYKSEEQKLQFKSLCTLIDFKYEYPGYDGKIRYGLYSALPTHCLQALFSDILAQIAPYLELDEGYMDARKEYRKNEKKFQYRNSVDNQFSTDDAFEEHHPEVATESFEDDFLRKYDYKKAASGFKLPIRYSAQKSRETLLRGNDRPGNCCGRNDRPRSGSPQYSGGTEEDEKIL